jgi:hypothetical protein
MGAEMTEGTPEVTPEPAAQPTEEPQDTTDWKAEARKWEDRAKQNSAAAKEQEKQRIAAMSESDRAVAEAEARGRTTATQAFAQRLAQSDFIAAAARRNPAWDAAAVLPDINLARYVGEDGEPDTKAIEKAVERLVPAAVETGSPSLDLGEKRTVTGAPNMTQLIRKAAGRA